MYNKRKFPWLVVLVSAAFSGFPGSVFSAAGAAPWLEVQVVSKQSGVAVPNAAVCLGTAARPDQFGARRSDDKGIVRFEDLLRSPLTVTVSKQGFQGKKQVLGAMQESRVLVLKIAPGGGGPQCDAAIEPVAAATSSGLSIRRLSVKAGSTENADRVLVSVVVSGEANQIRVSEQADFAGASWQTFESPIIHTLSPGKGVKQIYAQVRRFTQTEGASLEVISPVKKVNYRSP